MRVVTTPKAAAYIRQNGGAVWVWLDPHRSLVGAHTWLETHTEPPGTSRKTRFTRASRRPHRFASLEADGIQVHYDLGRLEPPEELLLDLRGLVNKRLEAYWNGNWFVDEGSPLPGG